MAKINPLKPSSWRVNKGIIWQKMAYSFYSLGVNMPLPFLALQLANIGLNDKEISYVLGFMPYFLIFTLPFTGFLGDKIGHKPIIIMNCILLGSALTSFLLVPIDKYSTKTPYVKLGYMSDKDYYELISLQWPICQGDKDKTTAEICAKSWIANDTSGLVDTIMDKPEKYIECDGNIVDESKITAPYELEFSNVTNSANGTFCSLRADVDIWLKKNISCILAHPDIVDVCNTVSDDHTKVFWICFLLALLFNIGMQSGFSLMDGISMRLAQIHNSRYTYILIWCFVFNTICPYIASLTIRDDSSFGDTDYSIMYYTVDAILVVTCVVLLKVDMNVERGTVKDENILVAIRKIWSVPMAIMIIGIFATGLIFGVHDAYLFIYLQRDLGASSQMLSYFVVIAWGSVLLILPFADKIVRVLGEINTIFLYVVIEMCRFFIYSYWQMSPPTYAYFLHAFEFTLWGLNWIAIISFGYKITPPNLAATMTSMVFIFEFIIAKSLAVLVVGQLTEFMNLPEIFRITSLVSCGIGLVSVLLYYTIGRKRTLELTKTLDEQFPDRFADDQAPDPLSFYSGQTLTGIFDSYKLTSF